MKLTAHKYYSSPNVIDVEARFNDIGYYEDYDYEFVRDLSNAISHTVNGGIVNDSFTGVDTQLEEFVSSLDLSVFSGNSPIAKASSVMAAIKAKENYDKNKEDGDSVEKEREKAQKNFCYNSNKAMKQFEKDCNSEGEGEESDKEGNGKPKEGKGKPKEGNRNSNEKCEKIGAGASFGNELTEFIRTNKKLFETGEGKEINPNNKTPEVALLNLSPLDIERIEKIALLKSRNKIKSRRQPAERKIQILNDYSDVSKAFPFSSVAMPSFKYKFATKQLPIKKEIPPDRQILICAIDNSGSMSCYEKIEWVRSIIYNRLDAVASGEAELYICWFVRYVDTDSIFKITNKKEAEAFRKLQFYGEFGGGGTDIQNVIEYLSETVSKGVLGNHKLKLVKPEILIINDGQDHVNPNFVPKIKTHAFILGDDNNALKKVVESSDGHYERFL